jgi:hypothetical protein
MYTRFNGIVLSVLYGVIGTLPWVIISYFGWIASLAGYVIGLAAYKGYVAGNGYFDRTGKITLGIFILLSIPLAEMFVGIVFATQQGYGIVDAIYIMPEVFFSNLGDFLPGILIGYLMAALGTYQFFIQDEKATNI